MTPGNYKSLVMRPETHQRLLATLATAGEAAGIVAFEMMVREDSGMDKDAVLVTQEDRGGAISGRMLVRLT